MATILQSTGEPFVEGTHDRATCVVYIKRSEAGFDLEVPCETTAPSGDKWYTLSKRREGDVEAGSGGPGTMEILLIHESPLTDALFLLVSKSDEVTTT